jgi:hypothetical protein
VDDLLAPPEPGPHPHRARFRRRSGAPSLRRRALPRLALSPSGRRQSVGREGSERVRKRWGSPRRTGVGARRRCRFLCEAERARVGCPGRVQRGEERGSVRRRKRIKKEIKMVGPTFVGEDGGPPRMEVGGGI